MFGNNIFSNDGWIKSSSTGRVVHLDVEDCSEELLRQQSYAIKNHIGHPKPPTRVFCLLLAGSLWHKGAYNRTFPCMEANYPYDIKRASKKPLVGGFGCDELSWIVGFHARKGPIIGALKP